MKKAFGLGLIVAIFFAIFVLFKDVLGASAFYMAAVSMAMFAVIGPFGDYFKTGLALLIGVVVSLAGLIILAQKTPLPPENTLFIASVSGFPFFYWSYYQLPGCASMPCF